MKVDFQKAYDNICWKFLEDCLNCFGFPDKMVNWVMTCISESRFSMNVNGELHGFFKGARGLRQGDPISPYIFTLVMEVFNLIMKRSVHDEGNFKYHLGCKGIKLTHLCFAYDLLLVCHGDVNTVKILKKSLNEFSEIYWLLPNMSKSTIFFGGVDKKISTDILGII